MRRRHADEIAGAASSAVGEKAFDGSPKLLGGTG